MRAVCVLTLALIAAAAAPARANDWAEIEAPASGDAEAIGGYSAGCVRGARALPLRGLGYQVVRPSRRRYFGHPALLAVIRDLARRARRAGLAPVAVADLAQPRGGPAPSGHASHQSGLDVDLWFRPAPRRLSDARREALSPRPVVHFGRRERTPHWSPRVPRLLQWVARDDRVARVFINPVIKRELCRTAKGDRAWLAKLRPWWGHDAHFHVRLACPPDSGRCEPQPAIAAGDGCDELDWWLDEKAIAERRKRRQQYRGKVASEPALPDACGAVLAQ